MLKAKYDLVVVGGGPVGVTAALRGAEFGYSTILIDATPPRQFQFTGPTGLYSKALRDSALRLDVPVLRSMGIVDAAIWAQVNEFVQQILRKSGDNNMKALCLNNVPHLRGMGRLRPSDDDGGARCSVEVAYRRGESITLRSDNVLLASGSRAVRLAALEQWYTTPLGGHVRCCDSDSIKQIDFLPRKVVVVGGGIIAIEFARIFAQLAAEVTMVVRAADLPKSLARVGIDNQIGYLLQADLRAAGITLLFESEIASAQGDCGKATPSPRARGATGRLRLEVVQTGTAEVREELEADLVLTATGRKAVTDGLGLDALGIEIRPNGDLAVSTSLMTSAKGVYAAGDVIGAPQLASTGIEQAESAIDAMLGRRDVGAAEDASRLLEMPVAAADCSPAALLSNAARYPIGIWTMPELAFVGLTAAAARAPPHNLDVVEGVGRYSESIRGHVHTVGSEREGEYLAPFMRGPGSAAAGAAGEQLTGPALKLVVERAAPHRIVGVHAFGEDACELIHFGTTLVQGGKDLSDITAVCFAAVTYHELFKLAARDAIGTLQCDAWRRIYTRLLQMGDGDASLSSDEVQRGLERMGADAETVDDILQSLFSKKNRGAVDIEQFVKRASRMRSPMQLDLMAAGDANASTDADAEVYNRLN